MLQLHRIFCATPWELEAERCRFHDVVGRFNQERAMPIGIVYVPVSLPNTRDKRPVQFAVDENIRDCRHYLLLFLDDWGPPERNFERDYRLAVRCAADSALPMHSVSTMRQGRFPGPPAPDADFDTIEEFEERLWSLLSVWMESEAGDRVSAAG